MDIESLMVSGGMPYWIGPIDVETMEPPRGSSVTLSLGGSKSDFCDDCPSNDGAAFVASLDIVVLRVMTQRLLPFEVERSYALLIDVYTIHKIDKSFNKSDLWAVSRMNQKTALLVGILIGGCRTIVAILCCEASKNEASNISYRNA